MMQCDTNGVFEDFIDCKDLEVNNYSVLQL